MRTLALSYMPISSRIRKHLIHFWNRKVLNVIDLALDSQKTNRTLAFTGRHRLFGNSIALRMVRVVCALIVLVAFFSPLTGCQSNDNSHKDNARRLLGKIPFSNLTDSIERFPREASLYLRRAAMLSQRGYPDMASPDYQTAWELSKDPSIALEYISNLLITGNIPEAIKMLRQQSAAFPGNTEFNRRLAEVFAQQGKADSAMKQFDLIIKKDPENFEAYYEKGNLLAQLKDTVAAIKALEKSFSILPINYSGLALANIYAQSKNPRALVICDKLLSSDSSNVETDPVYVKGIYYSEVKKYDSAIRQFDLCIKRDWKMTDAYIEKGIIFYEQKNTDSAMKIFQMAATVSNTDPDAYFWMGRCYEAKGDKQEAAESYDRAFALDHSFIEARQGLERVTR